MKRADHGAAGVQAHARRLRRTFTRAIGAAAVAAELGAIGACSSSDPSAPVGGGAASLASGDTGGAGGGAHDAGARDCKGQPYVPDASHNCGEYVYLPCGPPADAATFSQCYFTADECPTVCGNPAFNCHAAPGLCDETGKFILDDDGGVSIECAVCLGAGGGVGRVPRGLSLRGARGGGVGEHLARAASLEAASVLAFGRLASELTARGAPAELVAAASRAAEDERRHACATTRLAARRGHHPIAPRVRRPRARGLVALAIENAVEGCVHETLGALTNAWQITHAADADVAALARTLARDELRHAAVSWSVAAFCHERLDARSRERVARAVRRAVERLRRPAKPACPAARGLGLP
ncbi:MAG TPA: hypothetical protein VGM56_30960, partial [Byssovorax sp.]